MLMYKKEGGFHNFTEAAVAEAIKDGWVDGAAEFARCLSAKQTPVAKPAEVDTIAAQSAPRRTGRPRRAAQALTEEVSNGDSPDDN